MCPAASCTCRRFVGLGDINGLLATASGFAEAFAEGFADEAVASDCTLAGGAVDPFVAFRASRESETLTSEFVFFPVVGRLLSSAEPSALTVALPEIPVGLLELGTPDGSSAFFFLSKNSTSLRSEGVCFDFDGPHPMARQSFTTIEEKK